MRTRFRFSDIHPLEPATAEAEAYTKHDDFLPGGSNQRRSKTRTVLFHYIPSAGRVSLEENDDGSIDVVLYGEAADYPGSIPLGTDGTRDHVHYLHYPDGDPLLKHMNRVNRAAYDGTNRLSTPNTYRQGSEAAALQGMNEMNKRHFGDR